MTAARTLRLLGLAALAACAPAGHHGEGAVRTGGGPALVHDCIPEPGPESVGLRSTLGVEIDALINAAIADGAAPGAAVVVGRHGRVVHMRGYGRTDPDSRSPLVTDSTLYDLASLTKVVATTTAAMLLEERGVLDLDERVIEYLPAFSTPETDPITVGMLLTHRSGMTTKMLHREARGREEYLERFRSEPLIAEPGTRTRYSDWNMMTLQLVIEAVTRVPLDEFLRDEVYRPLGMHDTGFNPDADRPGRIIAPTEVQEWRGGKVHGEVHDENAWALGGVAGHAGLFSSARDLAVFAPMMLNGGEHDGVRLVSPATVARWTARQQRGSSRALGWDTPSPRSSAGRYFSPRSFGHTGFTGTSIWMDPQRDLFVILLTNRVNPTRENQKIGPLRRALADLVQDAVTDAPLRDWEAAMDGVER